MKTSSNTLSLGNRAALTLMLLAAAMLSGCASFEKNELSRVEKLPDLSEYQNKPSAYIDLHFYASEPGVKTREMPAHKEKLTPIVKKVFNESHAFSTVSLDSAQQETSDYTIQVDIYNHGNEAGAMISGFLTGYTLGLIPGAATDNYTVHMTAIDKQGDVVKEHQNKDSVQTWVGVWFIPAMGNTPEKAMDNTISNQIRHGLKEIIESKQLEYSELNRRQRSELIAFASTK